MSKTTNHYLVGDVTTRQVWMDGEELEPERAREVWDHSADGFNWGYMGGGAMLLALAIMLKATGNKHGYQDLVRSIVRRLPLNMSFGARIQITTYGFEGLPTGDLMEVKLVGPDEKVGPNLPDVYRLALARVLLATFEISSDQERGLPIPLRDALLEAGQLFQSIGEIKRAVESAALANPRPTTKEGEQ